ncbi:hypothetical protein EBZ39_17715 [bacterium]|nr:hypothetical protein [bacterium]
MLIQIENGKPVNYAVVEENFRQLFPNTSFPAILTADVVEPFGFGMYEFSPQPTAGKYEKVVEIDAVKDEGGVWRQTWSVVAMSDEEKAAADNSKQQEVRWQRDTKLRQSDFTQLPDSPETNKAVWATYRQALRDVPTQAGFPWEVQWPATPN